MTHDTHENKTRLRLAGEHESREIVTRYEIAVQKVMASGNKNVNMKTIEQQLREDGVL